MYGHQSGSGNYYSGFPGNAFADDTLTGVAPASGSGGSTTLLLQVIGSLPAQGQGANSIDSLSFDADVAWTKTSNLYGQLADGTGLYWQEWTAAGDNVPFTIDITSALSSIAIDAFQIDTYWTPSTTPVVNSRTSIGIPEPATLLMLVSGVVFGLARRS